MTSTVLVPRQPRRRVAGSAARVYAAADVGGWTTVSRARHPDGLIAVTLVRLTGGEPLTTYIRGGRYVCHEVRGEWVDDIHDCLGRLRRTS